MNSAWCLVDQTQCLVQGPDKVEQSVMERINVYKLIGERYIKVTYKEFSEEILVISAVDKGSGGRHED